MYLMKENYDAVHQQVSKIQDYRVVPCVNINNNYIRSLVSVRISFGAKLGTCANGSPSLLWGVSRLICRPTVEKVS
jgi:hypothetical protein